MNRISWFVLLSILFVFGCRKAEFQGGRNAPPSSSATTGPTPGPGPGPVDPNAPDPQDPLDASEQDGKTPQDPTKPKGSPENPFDPEWGPNGNPNTWPGGNPPPPNEPWNPNGPEPGGPSSAPNMQPLPPVHEIINVPCTNSHQTLRVEAPRNQPVSREIRGEFCPGSRLLPRKVLIVSDGSASMEENDPEDGRKNVPGSDPIRADGSCFRGDAIRKKIEQLKTYQAGGPTVQLAWVTFAGGLVKERSIPKVRGAIGSFFLSTMVTIPEFERELGAMRSRLGHDPLCSYVLQGHRSGEAGLRTVARPRGARETAVDSSTNYVAAMGAIQRTFANLKTRRLNGTNEVVFITDGMPTSGGPNPNDASHQDDENAGGTAAANVKSRVPNLQFNALVLGNSPRAREVLRKVTSDERILPVANAADLENQIVNFPQARFVPGQKVEALFSVTGRKTRNLVFMTNPPLVDKGNGVWAYQTRSFWLLGLPGQPVLNRVVVETTSIDDTKFTHQIDIEYVQQ